MKLKVSPYRMYGYFLGFISTFYILMIRGIPLFYFVGIIGILVFGLNKTKIDKNLLLYSIWILLSSIVGLLISEYMSTIFVELVLYVVIFVLILQFNSRTFSLIPYFVKGLKASCYFQLAWCLLQYLFYNVFEIDINAMIFRDTFHMVETASRYVNGKLVLSGLCWHPSNMIPVIVLAMLFSYKWYIWAICIFIVIKMQSSSAIIAIVTLVALKLGIGIHKMLVGKITKKAILIVVAGIIAVIVIFTATNVGSLIMNHFVLLYERIIGVQNDLSTAAHKNYYLLFPQVWEISSISQKIFGFGQGTSGVPISILTGQYTSLGAWVVETDVMNYIYSIGIIGTILVYSYFLKIMLKGKKDRAFYVCLMLPLLLVGITYNVQYYWVFFFESLVAIYKNKGYSMRMLFEESKDSKQSNKQRSKVQA